MSMKYLYKQSGSSVDIESHENLDLEIVTPKIRGESFKEIIRA